MPRRPWMICVTRLGGTLICRESSVGVTPSSANSSTRISAGWMARCDIAQTPFNECPLYAVRLPAIGRHGSTIGHRNAVTGMHGVAQAVGVEATYWASFSQKFDLSVMLVKYVGNNLCGNRLRRRK